MLRAPAPVQGTPDIWSHLNATHPEPTSGRSTPNTVLLVASSTVSITSVAFDAYVFESVHSRDGVRLERGEDANGNVLAVGAAKLQTHLGGWIAFQSRRAPNLLGLVEQVHPIGHEAFTDAFIIDTDDISLVRDRFAVSFCEQLVEIDSAAGPLIIIFDPGQDDSRLTTLFVAREARNDEVVAVTINVTLRVLKAFTTAP
ncbi:MAG: hypothetical protein ACI9ME_001623 [Ilumatobacter sp.]